MTPLIKRKEKGGKVKRVVKRRLRKGRNERERGREERMRGKGSNDIRIALSKILDPPLYRS